MVVPLFVEEAAAEEFPTRSLLKIISSHKASKKEFGEIVRW